MSNRRQQLSLPWNEIHGEWDEIDQAIELESRGWRARRDYGGNGGLHLSHKNWPLGEVSVGKAQAIEGFSND